MASRFRVMPGSGLLALLALAQGCVLAEEAGHRTDVFLTSTTDGAGWVHVEDVRLVPCEAAAPGEQARTLLRRAAEYVLAPQRARADHGVSSLSMTVRQPIPLDRDGNWLGVLRPPATPYCALEIGLTQAQAHSPDMPQTPVEGFSMTLAESQPPRVIRSFAQGVWRLPLNPAYTPDTGEPLAELVIEITPVLPASAATASPEVQGFALFEAARNSALARVR